MKFTLIEYWPVVKYMREIAETSKNEERRKNVKKLLNKIDKEGLIAWYGFENEYGEQYIILGWDLTRWWWAGDESDWETASSYFEDAFVNNVRNSKIAYRQKKV